MKPYADTSFFTRVYLSLPGSEQADRLVALAKSSGAPLLPITWLHRMELANAFELSVWLGKQGGHPRVTPQNAAVALETFQTDLAAEAFLGSATVEVSRLQPLFEEMVARHTAKLGCRTYDILHVVSARLLGCDRFFSFDARANRLAQIEGLKVTPL
ncbi:MAG: type II toxin-antitoxin system VapC family toxin [Lacunisphaera sp.]|nr:type II toxin-antitoxin system VapC family toxin [Lacunisphaera sp.]